jgi:hypothetical protein
MDERIIPCPRGHLNGPGRVWCTTCDIKIGDATSDVACVSSRTKSASRVLFLIALGAGLILGCGRPETTPSRSKQAAPPSVTTTTQLVTVRQVASVVAKYRDSLLGRTGMFQLCYTPADLGICTVNFFQLADEAGYLANDLALIRDVGVIPAEIRSLVSDTYNSASSILGVFTAWSKECAPQPKPACDGAMSSARPKIDALRGDLNEWQPYL